jgi:hypothetical protein
MTIVLVIAIILLAAWVAGLVTGATLGGLVHIVLVVAIVLLIVWMLRVVVGAF